MIINQILQSKFLSILVIIFLLFSCSEKKKEWKVLEAKLKTELTIGVDSTVYFSHPDFLVVDSNNNIVIADKGRSELLVFDKEGNFLNTIGERGPGPGQFRDITGMTINQGDEIFVLDRSSQTLKKFSVAGKYLESFILPSPITTKVKFRSWEDSQLLFFIRPNRELAQNYILHLLSKTFDKVIDKSIPAQGLDHISDNLIPFFIRGIGSELIVGNKLLYTPSMYNGYIYEYALSKNGRRVELTEKYEGYSHKNPITVISKNGKANSGYTDVTLSGPGVTMSILLHNQSKGLFQLKDGKIVHFTYIENKEGTKRTFGIEFYSKNMKPLGFAPIYSKKYSSEADANNLLNWQVVWKDEKERFYIVDTENVPKIRVVSLDYEI